MGVRSARHTEAVGRNCRGKPQREITPGKSEARAEAPKMGARSARHAGTVKERQCQNAKEKIRARSSHHNSKKESTYLSEEQQRKKKSRDVGGL
ncbi:hypothetical protein NDU88_008653 [Pleurodeles waltl]|uniref:Uncharacterized protein n=1 Tax=Pleurodeles waltl TaxID=8319 RepID=A0AAV7N9R3_PLEWA|nr:hypothetical protein NDU88_008653 [Pleurodeles waltl]